jgi:transketolase
MALVLRLRKSKARVYVMLGCGELDEGMIWEAAMSSAKFKLDNLLAIVDYNRLQLDGTNDEIIPLEPLEDKWKSFGWNVLKIDGHNFKQIIGAFSTARRAHLIPTVIIASTVKGKGVSYMENRLEWHGKAPNDNELKTALQEVEDDLF